MAFCDQCGNEINENAKFCSACGAKVSQQNASALNLKTIKCPSCHANLEYEENAVHIKCELCGADVVIDDDATELKRILKVKSEAKERDSQIDLEYEQKKQKIKIKDFIIANPIFCIVAVLLAVYALIRLIKGDFAGIDIIFDALILWLVYRITNKKNKK